jgi:hypothetical protein
MQSVNAALVDLYWQIGAIISQRIATAEWGDGTVERLALHIAHTQPGIRGFSRSNLLRMRQFYETYRDDQIVAPLVRQLPWAHNLIILEQSKHPEEREFYLRMAASPWVTERSEGTHGIKPTIQSPEGTTAGLPSPPATRRHPATPAARYPCPLPDTAAARSFGAVSPVSCPCSARVFFRLSSPLLPKNTH